MYISSRFSISAVEFIGFVAKPAATMSNCIEIPLQDTDEVSFGEFQGLAMSSIRFGFAYR